MFIEPMSPSDLTPMNEWKGTPPLTKPPKDHSDDEIRARPEYSKCQGLLPSSTPVAVVTQLTRTTLEAAWGQILPQRMSEAGRAFVDELRKLGQAIGDAQIIVSISKDDEVSVECQSTPATQGKWKAETYAQHVGDYTHEFKSGRDTSAHGTYRLRIAHGRREGETVFIELHEPGGRVLAFPPLNPDKPVVSATLVEVGSISQLMRSSSMKSQGQVPLWQVFRLAPSSE